MSIRVPAEALHLGDPLHEFLAPRGCARVVLVVSVFVVLIGLWTAIAESAKDDTQIAGVITGLVLAGLAAAGFWWAKRRLGSPERHVVLESGIAQVMRNGTATSIAWADVLFLRKSVTVIRHEESQGRHRRQKIISWYLRGEGETEARITVQNRRLGAIVEERVLPLLWPRIEAGLDAGRTVYFGGLGVGKDGLVRGEKILPWPELRAIRVARYVEVETATGTQTWDEMRGQTMANLMLLGKAVAKFSDAQVSV